LGYIFVAESLGISSTTFTKCTPKAAKFVEITQNKGHFAVKSHSRSDVFRMLDCLKPSATGLDKLPEWFLKLCAPVFAKFAAPPALLFNQSINCGIVPQRWKETCITPIPKVAHPTVASDYRPISITSVLSRMLERHKADRTYITYRPNFI